MLRSDYKLTPKKVSAIIEANTVIEAAQRVSSTLYKTSQAYASGHLSVFINGLEEFDVTEVDDTTFELSSAVSATDLVKVKYIKK